MLTFHHYTLLIESRSRVLEEVCSAEVIRVPTKNRPSPRVDKFKYCCYHQVAGHNTEECTTLKDKIKKLIQNGQLQRFIKDKDFSQDQDCEMD